MKSQQSTNTFVKETFMDLKTQLKVVAKNQQASIQNLDNTSLTTSDKQSGRPSGSLPSNTQPNPKGHNSKAYQPPQSRNEHVNAVFTRSGKSYNPPVNPNDQQNDSGNLSIHTISQGKEKMEAQYGKFLDMICDVRINVPLIDKNPYSIEGTLLEEEIFAEFDEFMAMTADENSDSESDTEDPPFEKITINTD
ncbi:hypothetical protein Tco_0602098 [Tanacetum coccineum]